MKRILILLLFFGLVIYWFTNGMLQTFFQQDEWYGLGYDLYLSRQPITSWFKLLGPSHFIPLAQFYWLLLYRSFGIHAEFYAINGLILHTIASLLVFLVSKRLTKNTTVSLLTSVLFATNSRSAQAFSNLAIPPATIGCFVVIMTYFLYLSGITNTIFTRKNLITLLVLFFTSVALREDGLILPVLTVTFLFFFNKRVFTTRNIWFFLVYYGSIAVFFVYRIYIQMHSTLAISFSSQLSKQIFLYNALTLPFKLTVTNIFEGIDLFNLFWNNKGFFYTEYHNQITVGLMYTVVFDFVILIVFTILTSLFLLISRSVKSKVFWRSIGFCASWILISAWLLAVLGRPVSVVESRYLYLSSFGVLLIFSMTLHVLFQNVNTLSIRSFIKKVLVVGSVIALIWYSYIEMQITLKRYIRQSVARKQILSDLVTLYPTIPKHTIFFVRCKKECYRNLELCGVPNDWVLPFTFGPGWAFMFMYAQHNESSYAPFFAPTDHSDGFLWNNASEGYKSIGDYGFGYFITKKLLAETISKENLSPEIIIGLEYDEDTFHLKDITGSIRDEIRTIDDDAQNNQVQ